MAFFVYCWSEGLRLPSFDNCPRCNGQYEDHRSSRRQLYDDQGQRPIIRDKHDERKHVPVYKRPRKMDSRQWCFGRSSRSQKRRLRRLRHSKQEEHVQEMKPINTQVWRVKQKADDITPSASVNMVSILPMEFKISADDKRREKQATRIRNSILCEPTHNTYETCNRSEPMEAVMSNSRMTMNC